MNPDRPIHETLFELQCIKEWGERYGWDSVEGLVKARIGVYETLGKGK
jgi:hypothetical protein